MGKGSEKGQKGVTYYLHGPFKAFSKVRLYHFHYFIHKNLFCNNRINLQDPLERRHIDQKRKGNLLLEISDVILCDVKNVFSQSCIQGVLKKGSSLY